MRPGPSSTLSVTREASGVGARSLPAPSSTPRVAVEVVDALLEDAAGANREEAAIDRILGRFALAR